MSRRPPALLFATVLVLVAAGVVGPLLATPAFAAYGSHVFQENPFVVPAAQAYPVYSGSTVAQSFSVNQTYILENLTLRVINNGSSVNGLKVSIHPDDPATHLPVMSTTLASWTEITPNNHPAPLNWSWAFSPQPILVAGSA